jgi:chemotaxis receptor (MCP) glutamine deamidase CheD
VAEEVGGLVNRTMYLNLATGQLSLKISGQQEEVVLCKR